MADRRDQTRERILATAEALALEKGFNAMSLNELVAALDLTKGAFFHHFRSKDELADALLQRYADQDYALFLGFARRAEELTADPLQRALIFLKLFEEWVETLERPLSGCLFTSFTCERGQFADRLLESIRTGFERWMALYEVYFGAVLATRRPQAPATARELAETIVAIIQGGLILTKALRDDYIVVRLSRQFRQHLELLFADHPDGEPARSAAGATAG